ncbi:hypothetical protein D3C84_920040 [compost metagenome]
MNWVVLPMEIVMVGALAAPLAVHVPLVTVPGTQPVNTRSLLTVAGGVVTVVNLPLESKFMVEGTGAVTPVVVGAVPLRLRPSIKV